MYKTYRSSPIMKGKEGRGLLIKYFLSIPVRVDLSAEDPE
jgi:hypothetical protein